MFGYRLVREADFDALRQELAAARASVDVIRAKYWGDYIAVLKDHERDVAQVSSVLLAAKEQAASRLAMLELQSTRVNQLELENAQHRHRETGLPAVAPQVVKGSPLVSDKIGAGVDLFADVGDDAAADLESRGLLHGPPKHQIDPFPTGADLTEGLAGGTPQ